MSADRTHIVVLAAGRGARMGATGRIVPKWLLPVGDGVIADHHMRAFATAQGRLGAHVGEQCVVTGHAADSIGQWSRDRGHGALRQVHNDEYLVHNNWYSLLLALRGLPADDRVVVVNADLVADPLWMPDFLTDAALTDEDALIAVDTGRRLTDESMKVAADGAGHLTAIGKVGIDAPCGEYIGMLMARGAVLEALRRTLASFEGRPERSQEWYERAVGLTAAEGAPWTLWRTPNGSWVEIDDADDHARADAVVEGALR